MKKRIKINGVIIFLAVLALALFPKLFFKKSNNIPLDEIAELFGVALMLLGQIVRVSARGYKSEYSQNGHALIQGGPYALVRNPMYLGILLIGFGVVLILFRWWVVYVFLFIFVIRYLLLIFKEEKKLSGKFASAYQNYCRQVPRLMPSWRALGAQDLSRYLPLKIAWLKNEIGSILTVLLITLAIESWEDIAREGVKVYFQEAIGITIIIGLFLFFCIHLIRQSNKTQSDVATTS
jgi:protein-S-isoprenylcysteine O-methyltransferase Ste14